MEVEELCTRFTADLTDFKKKTSQFAAELTNISGVTDRLRKDISKAMQSPVEKVQKLGRELSAMADKQIKVSEKIAETKHKFEDYKTVLAAIQEKQRMQREEMQKLIDKYNKLTAVQKKQQEFVKETDGGAEGIIRARKEITDYIHDMSSGYEQLKKKIEGYGGLKPFDHELKQLSQFETDIKRAKDELKIFDSQLIKLKIDPAKLNAQSFSMLDKEIDGLRNQIGRLKQSEMDLTAKEESLTSAMANTSVKLNNLKSKAAEGAETLNAMSSRLKSVNKATGKAGSLFGKFKTVIGSAGKGVMHLGKSALGVLKNRLTHTGKSAAGLSSKLLHVTKSIRRIGIVAIGLKVVKSVFGELRSVVSKYISENDGLNSRIEAVKNSFGQALAPAIELVTGLFEKLMPYVVSVTNAISDLLSSLGISAALKSTSSAVDGVTSSTKKLSEAQNDLYGFDQITKVSEKSSENGSSSDSEQSYSASKKLTEYLQKLKNLWQSSDFEGIGSAIAGSLNKVISKINNLDWNGIQNKVNGFVSGITRSLNGFVSDFDWDGAATILSNGLNTLIGAINTFASTFKFQDFGNKLAGFLLKGIETIDWKQTGETIKNLIVGLCNAIAGFFNRLSEGDQGYEAIKNAVIDLFNGLNIGEIALSILKAIISIGNFSFNFVGNLFDDIWNWLLDLLGIKNKELALPFKISLKMNFMALIGGPLSSFSKLMSLFFGKDNVNEKGEVTVTANAQLKGKTSSSFETLRKKLSEIKDKRANSILKGKEDSSFTKAKAKWDSVKDKVNIDTIKGAVQNTFSNLKSRWDSIKNKTNTLTSKGSVQSTFTNLKSKWDSIKTKYNTATIKGSISSTFNDAKKSWDNIKSKAVTLTTKLKDNATAAFKKVFNNIIDKLNSAIKNVNKFSIAGYKPFNLPTIPRMETGGIVSKPTIAMVGEHGREAVMPLENNTGWITQLAAGIASILNKSNPASQGPIVIPIYIGGKHLTDIVVDDINKQTKATGNCPIRF